MNQVLELAQPNEQSHQHDGFPLVLTFDQHNISSATTTIGNGASGSLSGFNGTLSDTEHRYDYFNNYYSNQLRAELQSEFETLNY